MYIKKIIRFQIPIKTTQSGLSYFEEVARTHGRRISMKNIKEILEDRFGT